LVNRDRHHESLFIFSELILNSKIKLSDYYKNYSKAIGIYTNKSPYITKSGLYEVYVLWLNKNIKYNTDLSSPSKRMLCMIFRTASLNYPDVFETRYKKNPKLNIFVIPMLIF
jgi:hypothetical protein